jgi:ubiquitin-conjugating enzyme E2 J1
MSHRPCLFPAPRHFTLFPPAGTDFEGGKFHGKIVLPTGASWSLCIFCWYLLRHVRPLLFGFPTATDYPLKPPDILFLNKNGRFEINTKICLSITGFHSETWSPSWNVRSILEALIAFMPTPGNGAIGALNSSKEERQVFAKRSHTYKCDTCGAVMAELVPTLPRAAAGASSPVAAGSPLTSPLTIPAGASLSFISATPLASPETTVMSPTPTTTTAAASTTPATPMRPLQLNADTPSETRPTILSTLATTSPSAGAPRAAGTTLPAAAAASTTPAALPATPAAAPAAPTMAPHANIALPLAVNKSTSCREQLSSLFTVLLFLVFVILLVRKVNGWQKY